MILRMLALLAVVTLAACEAPVIAAPPAATGSAALVQTGAFAPQSVQSFEQIVRRMEPVVERECRIRAPRLNCDFAIQIFDNPRLPPNAFQTLDDTGRPVLGFTAALIEDVRNADELAFVLGHEAAHHIAGHLSRQAENATLGAAIFGALAAQTGATADGVASAQELGAAVGARSYSKDFELEADRLGTILTQLSGYDPLVGAAYFNRIPDPGNRFLGTHPPNAQRIAVVQDTVAGF
ncbi:MAG: M48 family metallopeptidase [Pseudomonadota bacterium]